jgi:PAS domain S-box-containing protein
MPRKVVPSGAKRKGRRRHLKESVRPPESPAHGANFEVLFYENPQPMYVFDRKTLELLEVNVSACRQYGHSRAELLRMPVTGICLREDLLRLLSRIERDDAASTAHSTCRHRGASGQIFEVEISTRAIAFKGRRAILAVARDANARKVPGEFEGRFRHLFENAIEGMFQSTPDGEYTTVNPALARMYGYSSPAEFLAQGTRGVTDTLHTDPSPRIAFMRRMEQEGAVHGFEYPIRRKDGVKIWVSANARTMRNEAGEIVGYEGTIEDVSERKRSELERQVTTEVVHIISVSDSLDELFGRIHGVLQKALYAKNCIVALYDSSTGVFQFPFFVDERCTVPSPTMVWRTCAAYVYRVGRAMLIPPKHLQELIDEGEVDAVSPAPQSWLGVPLRGAAGSIGVLVVQHYGQENVYTERDLEFLSSIGDQIAFAIERKRAEARIRESEARLRVLIEKLPAVLWTVDKDLRFTSAVGAGLARLGLKPNQMVGRLLPEYFETSDPDSLAVAAHRRAVVGEPVTFHLEWKEGSYACHAEPLRGSNGEVLGAICMALDVTDRKQLEERFRQAQKMEAVGRLAGGIAHDFNNLLMVIQGYADLLADRLPPGDSLRRNAEQIQLASQRAIALTQQLLAFSRKQILAPKVLSIQSIVADMEKILRRLIGEDIELETSSERDLWLVKADRSQIEQVILNLAVNARDAMPNGGRLTIETANMELDQSFSNIPAVVNPGKYVMLAVTDNGTGMDHATRAHIFEPFFTTKEKGKGTGLGLATVYGIVKQSGGYIWVYSEPGHGTTFKVYLPRIEEETSTVSHERSEKLSLPRGAEVILLVEDERGVRELARQYLEMTGYSVIEAEDGYRALELAATHTGPIQLLLTDVVMPGMSGRELAERMAQIRPGIKVLYMSGYTDQAVVRHGVLQSDAVLLQKPFTLATLASKLRDLLAVQTVH